MVLTFIVTQEFQVKFEIDRKILTKPRYRI